MNQAGREMVGLSQRGVTQPTTLQSCFFAEDVPYIFGEFFQQVFQERNAEVEVRLRHFTTSEPLWLVCRVSSFRDANGNVTALTAIGLDITALKQTEERLRVSEERFRSYFQLGLIGMAITSPSKGILEVNDKICEILGYERSELLHCTWVDFAHPNDVVADVAQFSRVLASEIDAYELEKRWTRKDGGIVDSIISVRSLRHSDGSVNHIVPLLENVTERRRAEANREFLAEVNATFAQLSGRKEIVDVMLHKLLGYLNLSRCAFETTNLRRLSQEIETLSSDLLGLSHRLHPSILEDLGWKSR
jgi:PAS domain S-box-containing protein